MPLTELKKRRKKSLKNGFLVSIPAGTQIYPRNLIIGETKVQVVVIL